jgi:hypothetical protein
MLNADEKQAIDRIANKLQIALLLASRFRSAASEHSEESIRLEAAIDAAARAMAALKPGRK